MTNNTHIYTTMKRLSLLLSIAVGAVLCSFAQHQNGSYFMDGMTLRHELNPAFESEYNYFSMPILGNLSVGIQGNLHPGNIFMDRNGKTVSFTDSEVLMSDLKFKEHNKLNEDLRLQILGVGFRGMGGYNTIGVNVRQDLGFCAPGEIFPLLKKIENKDYNVGDLDLRARAWAEVALGHSHKVNDQLRLGGKVKLLLGVADAQATVRDIKLDLSSHEKWVASMRGQMHMSMKGLSWGELQGDNHNEVDFENLDVNSPGLSGVGLALDLGAEYAFKGGLDGFKLSASVTDLGFIKWNNSISASTSGQPYEFYGFDNDQIVGGNVESLNDQLDNITDKLDQLITFYDEGTTSRTTSLGATLRVGAEYSLPMYKRLKFGFLSTTRFQGHYTWNEERLSASINPVNALELCVNGGMGTYGPSFGWVLNIKPKGFNLFVGMDKTFTKFRKNGIPVKANGDVFLGLNFTFGHRK